MHTHMHTVDQSVIGQYRDIMVFFLCAGSKHHHNGSDDTHFDISVPDKELAKSRVSQDPTSR